MINIQNEVQNIHSQYGMSEMANYKIQLLCEQYAKEYHDSKVKKLNIPAVSNHVCRTCKGTGLVYIDDVIKHTLCPDC